MGKMASLSLHFSTLLTTTSENIIHVDDALIPGAVQRGHRPIISGIRQRSNTIVYGNHSQPVRLILTLILAGLVWLGGAPGSLAQNQSVGTVTKFKIPRFVSLKSDRVNVRVGPSTQHNVKFAFVKRGLPVEIIQEFDNWRRIRDFEGSDGWVHHSLLSGARTAIVTPWLAGIQLKLYAQPSQEAAVHYLLEAGVLADIEQCTGNWCELSHESFEGWMQQENLWGVYTSEIFD